MKYLKCCLMLILLLLIVVSIRCKKNGTDNGNDEDLTDLTGEYLGQEPPGMEPVRFAPDILQADENWWWHGSPVFSPDGYMMFFGKLINSRPQRIEINYMKLENGRWTSPKNPSFAAGDGFNNPCFSEDGNRLYFISGPQDLIYYVDRTETGWSQRQVLNLPIPSSFTPGWQFSISRDRNIYLELWDSAGPDLYVIKYNGGNYSYAEKLGTSINTSSSEFSPFIDPDEDYIIFTSNRPGGYGFHDLYISFKNPDGTWAEAKNMGSTINSGFEDVSPWVSHDGRYFFYGTQKTGDLGYNPYWVDAGIIDDLMPDVEPSDLIDGSGGGIIAFSSDRDGSNEIYIMNADGSGQTRITNDSYEDFFPKWSPDGTKLAFVSSRAGGLKTFIMDVVDIQSGQFSEPQLLVDLPGPGGTWSPDGTQMALLSQYNGIFRLFLVNSDGSNLNMIENITFEVTGLDWSPDGDEFAFTANNNGLNIGIMNIDGSNNRFITSSAQSFAPAWSPDGTKIAFNYGPGDGQIDIYVINVDGTNLRRITTYNNHDEFPSWSPDGSKITYESDRGGLEKIFVINSDGINPVQLTNSGGNDGGPDWRPVY